jgi:multidrug resistance efflux pump
VDEDVKHLLVVLTDEMRQGFAQVNARLDGHDARFDAVDARLAAHDTRFDAIDARLAAHDARFVTIDARFDAIDARFEKVDAAIEKVAREAGVIAEDLRRRIQLTAEGLNMLEGRFDRLEQHVTAEIAELKAAIPISFRQLNDRMHNLEVDNADLHSRDERLESSNN